MLEELRAYDLLESDPERANGFEFGRGETALLSATRNFPDRKFELGSGEGALLSFTGNFPGFGAGDGERILREGEEERPRGEGDMERRFLQPTSSTRDFLTGGGRSLIVD